MHVLCLIRSKMHCQQTKARHSLTLNVTEMSFFSSTSSSGRKRPHDESCGGLGEASYSTTRKFCPHCDEIVAVKTYKAHKRLYFGEVSLFSSS